MHLQPNNQRWHAKCKIMSEHARTACALFARSTPTLRARSVLADKNFCIGAQEEVYQGCVVGRVPVEKGKGMLHLAALGHKHPVPSSSSSSSSFLPPPTYLTSRTSLLSPPLLHTMDEAGFSNSTQQPLADTSLHPTPRLFRTSSSPSLPF